MKKTWGSLILAGILSLSLSAPVFAGSWQFDTIGYWYQNDDGSYPVNCWQWIDGNNDGVAESYYFNDQGYILVNTTTPDGYTVDTNGAWIVNGVVQTKTVSALSVPSQPETSQKQETNSSATLNNTSISDSVWLSATGSKYHRINNCGRMNPNKARSVSLDEAIRKGYDACDKCY